MSTARRVTPGRPCPGPLRYHRPLPCPPRSSASCRPFFSACCSPALRTREEDVDRRAEALEILRQVPLIDGHNDIPWQFRTRYQNRLDAVRLPRHPEASSRPCTPTSSGCARAASAEQFWSVYIPVDMAGPGAARATFEQIDFVQRLAQRYPDVLEIALSAHDVERIHADGRVASLIGMEGGHSIESSLPLLRQLYAAGAPLHDAHPFLQRALGGLGDRPTRRRRPEPLRARGRARDEPPRHARRPLARLRRDDGRRARDERGAGHLLPLVGPRDHRACAQRAPTTCCAGSRRTAGW